MCLLNGDMGGSLPASIDFGKIDSYDYSYEIAKIDDFTTQYQANKYYVWDDKELKFVLSSSEFDQSNETTYYNKSTTLKQEKLTIETIIREAVHTYANEPYHNIIINDLMDYGLELLEYRGDEPLFLLYDEFAAIYTQIITFKNASEENIKIVKINKDFEIIEELGQSSIIKIGDQGYNTAIDNFNDYRVNFYFIDDINKTVYSATKLNYGNVAGYRETPLVYAGELISSIGESLTSILDKIKNMLGAFEYFYNLDGRFVFQAKKIYANNSWNTLVESDKKTYAKDLVDDSPYSYSFEDVNLIQKFSNSPSLNNLKNDYSVWGVRKTATGAEIPIHSRYAIHKKPEVYITFDKEVYCSNEDIFNDFNNAKLVDWREIIYQMAKDYFKHNQEANFQYLLKQNNLKPNKLESYYPDGLTTYEMFYTDIQGFWRQLYNPEPEIIYENEGGYYISEKFYQVKDISEDDFKTFKSSLFILKNQDNNLNYFISADNHNQQNIYTNNINITEEQGRLNTYLNGFRWEDYMEFEDFTCDFYLKSDSVNDENYSTTLYYWNKNLVEAPDLLNFWFDFYDIESEIGQYAIPVIGDRPKVVNNNKITSIYFRNVPKIIFTDKDNYNSQDVKTGYTYVWTSNGLEDLFSISAQGKSAEDETNELFNKHSYCSENINLTTIPIYNLDANTLIYIHNEENYINGKYEINKITIPLSYNGMMQISATKIIDPVV